MIRFCSLYCKISIPLTSRGTPTSNFQDLDLRPGIHRQTYKHSEQRVMKGVTKSQFPVHSYLHLDWRKSLIFLVSSLCLTALVGKVLVRLTLSSFAATVIVTFIGAGENLRRLFTGTELCARGSTSYKSNWLGNVYFFLQIQSPSSVFGAVLSYTLMPYTLTLHLSFCPHSYFYFIISRQSFSDRFGNSNKDQLASGRSLFNRVIWVGMPVIMCSPWCHSLKFSFSCWFSTSKVRSDSKFRFTSKSGNEDRSLILLPTLRSDWAISSSDFKHLFGKVPSVPSLVSFA